MITASELLIVTFTRAATNELRAKVRERLVAAAEHLAAVDPAHLEAAAQSGDDVLDLLTRQHTPGQLERVQRAVAEFDGATVTTIHGFATQVLGALGVTAGTDPDARLDAGATEPVAEACADVLVTAAVGGAPVEALPRLDQLVRATDTAAHRADLDLVPTADQVGATREQTVLTDLVRRSLEVSAERRRSAGTLSFDDVLVQLRSALHRPGASSAVDSLRSRFGVVLIDEFQDTDSVQWDIFSTLFDRPGSGSVLVLVGDPKQAIYSFRGADVHTYLDAVDDQAPGQRTSLAVNWRSDADVLTSLGAVFEGVTFGSGIPFVPVEPAPANRQRRIRRLRGSPVPGLDLRMAIGPGIERQKRNDRLVIKGGADRAVATDLVTQVRSLLDEGELADESVVGGWRPVRPPDIAVLVGRHADGAAIQAALIDQGVPAVVARSGNVLESPAADQVRWLLHALERPSDPRRARMYCLSWFGGRTAAELATLEDDELVATQEQLRRWAEQLAVHSVADVLAQIWSDSGLVERVLGSADGDRSMTDLDHVAELLQAGTPTGRSGVPGLLAVLDAEPAHEGDSEVDGDVAARRIASEADSVQIMTVWTAKGLQFPIVCVPTLWHAPSRSQPVIYVDPTTGRRTFDLAQGKDWPDEESASAREALAFHEADGERLRLLYVAMTRAQHHTMVWWARAERSDLTALARVLFARSDGVIDPVAFARSRVVVPPDDEIVGSIHTLQAKAGGSLTVSVLDQEVPNPDRWSRPSGDEVPGSLELASFDVVPDRSTQRWSFSAIVDHTSVLRADPSDPTLSDGGAADEQGDDDIDPDPDRVPDPVVVGSPDRPDGTDRAQVPGSNRAGPLSRLPAGTAFGTLVHSVLEEVDFAADDLSNQLVEALDRQLEWRDFDLTPTDVATHDPDLGRRLLVEGLLAAITTPLGSLVNGIRLADVSRTDRLTELSFDLRLADGSSRASVRDLGAAVLAHLEPDDPLMGWAAELASGPMTVPLAGHLTGSIDLVFRTPDAEGTHRYVVADYKTNALHRRGVPATPDDYGPVRLAGAMADHDYPLQALLYSVALHRYLRWRLRGYRPEDHLGGVAYLFVRGMTGPGAQGPSGPSGAGVTGNPPGVFGWSPPPSLVVELSDLLDGHPVTGSAS
jgi:exodeoxyribonuclease V beta subunit